MVRSLPTLAALVSVLSSFLLLGGCDDREDCYSPTQNLDSAYDPGSVGCACRATEAGRCIDGVALLCEVGRWQAVVDGPCFPPPGEVCGDGFCSQFAYCGEDDAGAPECVPTHGAGAACTQDKMCQSAACAQGACAQ